jgi:hypothetical protein
MSSNRPVGQPIHPSPLTLVTQLRLVKRRPGSRSSWFRDVDSLLGCERGMALGERWGASPAVVDVHRESNKVTSPRNRPADAGPLAGDFPSFAP